MQKQINGEAARFALAPKQRNEDIYTPLSWSAELLRIRSYGGRWTVTHKRIPDTGVGEDRHKHRVETETEVAAGAVLADIFTALGLVAAFRYE